MTTRATKIVVDVLMVIFLILSFLGWYGMEIFHYVVGTICYLLFVVHVYLNRQWMASVKKAYKTGKLKKAVKRQYWVNKLLIIFWIISFVSGIIAIPVGMLEVEALMPVFTGHQGIHVISSRLGLVLIIYHIVQHKNQIRLYFTNKRKMNQPA